MGGQVVDLHKDTGEPTLGKGCKTKEDILVSISVWERAKAKAGFKGKLKHMLES